MTVCTAPTAASCTITRAIRSRRCASGPLLPSVLAGPTCDSIDVIAENLQLPQLKAGDLIVGRAMGAYTWAERLEIQFLSEGDDHHGQPPARRCRRSS